MNIDDFKMTAKETRKIADESENTLMLLYSMIRDRAERNEVYLTYNADHLSEVALAKIIGQLEVDGFKVTWDYHLLVVEW